MLTRCDEGSYRLGDCVKTTGSAGGTPGADSMLAC